MKLFIHSQISTTVQPLKFRKGYVIALYWACDYLSMLELKLIHVIQRGPWWKLTAITHNTTQKNMVEIYTFPVFELRLSNLLVQQWYFLIFYKDKEELICQSNSISAGLGHRSGVNFEDCISNYIFQGLNVLGLSHLGLTRSISWLLMPWLLSSPGHQQPWYWLCRIGRFLSYLRKDFNYLRRINVEKWHKM